MLLWLNMTRIGSIAARLVHFRVPGHQKLEKHQAIPGTSRPPKIRNMQPGRRQYGQSQCRTIGSVCVYLLSSRQLCRSGLNRLVIAIHVCWRCSSVSFVAAPIAGVSLAHIMRASAARLSEDASCVMQADEVVVDSMRLCANVRRRRRVVFAVMLQQEDALAVWLVCQGKSAMREVGSLRASWTCRVGREFLEPLHSLASEKVKLGEVAEGKTNKRSGRSRRTSLPMNPICSRRLRTTTRAVLLRRNTFRVPLSPTSI